MLKAPSTPPKVDGLMYDFVRAQFTNVILFVYCMFSQYLVGDSGCPLAVQGSVVVSLRRVTEWSSRLVHRI